MKDVVTIATLERDAREASRAITKLNDNMTVMFYDYSGDKSADVALTHGMLASTHFSVLIPTLPSSLLSLTPPMRISPSVLRLFLLLVPTAIL